MSGATRPCKCWVFWVLASGTLSAIAVAALSTALSTAHTAIAPGVAAHQRIDWADLAAPGWDPLKAFRSLDTSRLDDRDPAAAALLQHMRDSWDNAPTNGALDGAAVRVSGFVVALQMGGGSLQEFLLVPYFGACVHSPPPPSNQIIRVQLAQPSAGLKTMDAVMVTGRLSRDRSQSDMGTSSWRLEATAAERLAVNRD